MQQGDIYKTHGDNKKIAKKINFKRKIKLADGIKKFIQWYKEYYGKS